MYLYLYLRYISKVSSPTLLISNTKPLCDETNATVANNSARVHEDLMVPSALRAARHPIRGVRLQKSRGEAKKCVKC